MATQLRRILCPFDFSNAAVNAATFAAQLAKDTDMELLLLYIHQQVLWQGIAPMDGGVFTYHNELAQEMPNRIEAFVESLRETHGIPCDYVAKRHVEQLSIALAEEIQEGKPDLVVMGTSGASYGSLFTTNTYQVARKTSRPLLMIPKDLAYKPLQKIIYGTDYHSDNVSHIGELLQWTAPYDPQLTVVHIRKEGQATDGESFAHFQEKFRNEYGTQHTIQYRCVVGNDVPGLLHEAMKDWDLLVLLAKQYGFFENFFHRSTIRRLSSIARYPLLIYPDKA